MSAFQLGEAIWEEIRQSLQLFNYVHALEAVRQLQSFKMLCEKLFLEKNSRWASTEITWILSMLFRQSLQMERLSEPLENWWELKLQNYHLVHNKSLPWLKPWKMSNPKSLTFKYLEKGHLDRATWEREKSNMRKTDVHRQPFADLIRKYYHLFFCPFL